MLSWLFSPRSCADPQDGAASPPAAATPPPATPSGTTAGPAAWAVQATPSSSVQHRLTVTAQAAGPAVQRYNTRPTTRSTSDVGSRTKAQPKLERSANGLLCFRAGLQCIPHCTHPYCGPRGLHRCTKAKLLWWRSYVKSVLTELNKENNLIGAYGQPGQVGKYVIHVTNTTESAELLKKRTEKVKKIALIRKGVKLAQQRMQEHMDEIAGAARIRKGESKRAYMKGRKYELEMGENGRAVKATLGYGYKMPTNPIVNRADAQHREQLHEFGITQSKFLHRHDETGRCEIVEQREPLAGCTVIGVVPNFGEWIVPMLEAEDRLGRLQIDLDDPSTLNRWYDVDVVLGADEFSIGNSIGNAIVQLTCSELFLCGQSRAIPGPIWNGKEHFCVEVYEAYMRELSDMTCEWKAKVQVSDVGWLGMNLRLRILTTDNKLFAALAGALPQSLHTITIIIHQNFKIISCWCTGQMAGSAHMRFWMLCAHENGRGIHIDEADDVAAYSEASLEDKAKEHLNVLHRTAQRIVGSAADGPNKQLGADALRRNLRARQLDASGSKEELVERLNEAEGWHAPTWVDLTDLLNDIEPSALGSMYEAVRKTIGVQSFPVFCADNDVALRTIIKATAELIGEEQKMAYLRVLLELDEYTSPHPLKSRCSAAFLEAVLHSPDNTLDLRKGCSLVSVQFSLAMLHTLRHIGRTFIYQLALGNHRPEMRLSADAVRQIERAVLAAYRSEARPANSHVDFVYCKHVKNAFANVEKTFARCPKSFRTVAHLIALVHTHFSHLSLRHGSIMPFLDKCSNDLAQLAEIHGVVFALPLMGQLLGAWNMNTQYWVGMRLAPFKQVSMAELDGARAPISLRLGSEDVIEQAHRTPKEMLRSKQCTPADLEQVQVRRAEDLRAEASGHGSASVRNVHTFVNVCTCGICIGQCITCGWQQGTSTSAAPAEEFLAERHREEDDDDTRINVSDTAAVASADITLPSTTAPRSPQQTTDRNLSCIVAAVDELSQRAGVGYHFEEQAAHVFGLPALAAEVLCEVFAHQHQRAIKELTDFACDLPVGVFALSVSAEPQPTSMRWEQAAVITVQHQLLFGKRATVTHHTEAPVDGVVDMRVTVAAIAWSQLAAAAPAVVRETVMAVMCRGHIATNERALRRCCLCDVKPMNRCMVG